VNSTTPSISAAVNSALQRARERIAREHEQGTLARLHAPTDAATEAAVMTEFLDARRRRCPRIVALLTDDALLTMPDGSALDGAAAIGEFPATQPARVGWTGLPRRHPRQRATRQPPTSTAPERTRRTAS
jgi:hypothetical protein